MLKLKRQLINTSKRNRVNCRELIFQLTVSQKEDGVLGFVDLWLNSNGIVKCLFPFVLPVAGMELFLYQHQKHNTTYPQPKVTC